ncbi:Protein unc-45 like protein B [Daldinia childiae]|uniref:Protein unc-45 like protein B n=1 Tax=Daldinia childiae TaxID=326645 RepID=UPI001446DD55|nr:Protein unc-45 like protein B [Daldinia childiae]KAF3067402.1 Protein unc-45 like protein B [Daldinia childiae]
MDTKDISDSEKHIAFIKQSKENAERARLRKGEKPRDHPPRSALVSQFLMKLFHSAGVSDIMNHKLYTSQVPPYYPPCIHPAQDLKPLMISEMMLEIHHRGSYALVRVLTPPDRMTAVMAIVEDEEGTAVLLQLYNQPEESKVAKENILKARDICIIKEPFFKVTNSGSYSLRVDHVSDIIWLEDTDNRIPLEWRNRFISLDESSEDIRKEGNEAVQKKDWANAERLYTDAIRAANTAKEKQLAYLNRSLTNLYLDRPEKASADAQKGNMGDDSLIEKALFREAKALYTLGKFGSCLEKLMTLVRSNPKNSGAWAEIKRVKQRLREEEKGSYQFNNMYKQAEDTPPLIDCATYVGSVAVRDSPGRGKGLFTTKVVKAGELLLCEKAFAYSYAGNDSNVGKSNTTVLMNWHTNIMSMGGQANLITQIVQKLYRNHDGGKVFTELYHGDYTPVAISEVDGAPVVDTFLIVKTIQLNSFGAPRTSYKSTMLAMVNQSGEQTEKSAGYTTCGIWPIASRINHSCVTNCYRTFIGDMQIVRATQDLKADTELHFMYRSPGLNETYDQTQKKLKGGWGFACNCALCFYKKSTPQSTIKKREALFLSLNLLLQSGFSPAQLSRARKMMEDLEKTYTAERDAPPVVRSELSRYYFAAGNDLIPRNKLIDGLEMILKGLETLGYVVEARPPRDMGAGKNAVIEIKRWGEADENILWALTSMMQAYGVLAPELCNTVKGYANIIYSICCGESETIGKIFPGFA